MSAGASRNIGEMIAGVKRRTRKTKKVKRAFNIVRRAIFIFHRGGAEESGVNESPSGDG